MSRDLALAAQFDAFIQLRRGSASFGWLRKMQPQAGLLLKRRDVVNGGEGRWA